MTNAVREAGTKKLKSTGAKERNFFYLIVEKAQDQRLSFIHAIKQPPCPSMIMSHIHSPRYLFHTFWNLLAIACLACFFLVALPSSGQSRPLLWSSQTPTNTIYLLGSIHALSRDDFPLNPAYEKAYDDADKIVLEVNLSEGNITRLMTLTTKLGTFEDDRTLKDVLGQDKFQELNELGLRHGFSLAAMNNLEPWLVGLTAAQILLQSSDLSPELGVDKHFENKAIADSKPVGQLETIEDQLRLFDEMDMDLQILFLETSLREFKQGKEVIDQMVTAWREGDTQTLANILNDEIRIHKKIAERLLVDRNKKWADQIETYFGSDKDILIIVGAGHLVGPDSLVKILEDRGYDFTRAGAVDEAD